MGRGGKACSSWWYTERISSLFGRLEERAAVENNSNTPTEYTPPAGGGGVTEEIRVGKNTVTLGHGGRHLDGTNLSVSQVNQAIAMDVCKNPPKPGEYLVRTIEIGGVSIGYRVYARSDSTFHVGTYHVIKG